MDLETLVLAARRESRSQIPKNWQELVRSTPGVISASSTSNRRMQIVATLEALAAIRLLLGDYLHVEAEILRNPSATPNATP